MKWDVVAAKAEADWTLSVQFADGLRGRVRFSPDSFCGVFEPIRDPEIDLAPDAMYEQIRMHGEWLIGASASETVAPA